MKTQDTLKTWEQISETYDVSEAKSLGIYDESGGSEYNIWTELYVIGSDEDGWIIQGVEHSGTTQVVTDESLVGIDDDLVYSSEADAIEAARQALARDTGTAKVIGSLS